MNNYITEEELMKKVEALLIENREIEHKSAEELIEEIYGKPRKREVKKF